MKLVRSDEIFCFLRNDTIFRRQQFRADRRVEHIQKDIGKCFFPAGVRIILHQMAHQGFRYGRIDGIHRHMVAIVRCPAKCQLGKITSSNDHTAGLVGKIHQNLRSLTRLSVFIRHIVFLRILSDIAEMKIDCLLNIDLF